MISKLENEKKEITRNKEDTVKDLLRKKDEEITYTREKASMFSSKMKEELANLKNLSNKVEKQKIEELQRVVEKLTIANKEYKERLRQLEDKDEGEEVAIFGESASRRVTRSVKKEPHSDVDISQLMSGRNEVCITPVAPATRASPRYLKLKHLSDMM